MIWIRVGIPFIIWIGICGGFLMLVSVSKKTAQSIGEGTHLLDGEEPIDMEPPDYAELPLIDDRDWKHD